MFLFNRMNKRIQTGNNGRGPGGPRLPSDRRSDADDVVEYSCRWNEPPWQFTRIGNSQIRTACVR